MKNILNLTFVIIGTLVGAGFASGQEIYTFFFSYGIKGIIGIIISSIITGSIIYFCLEIIRKNKIENYKDFIDVIFNKNTSNKNIKKIWNIIINTFILITFFIMIAGFGAYFNQQYGLNVILGSSILVVITYIILKKGTKGVIILNEIIVPILIIFIIIIGITISKEIDFNNITNYIIRTNNKNWLISSILYSSYNSILLTPVLISMNKIINKKEANQKIALLTIIITIILSLIIYAVLIKVDVNIEELEMPAVYTISKMGIVLKEIYGIILLSSIITTTISLINSFLQNVAKNEKSYSQLTNILCITSLIISNLGFSNLVNILYPIFGLLGLIQIWKIVSKYYCKKK